MAPWAETLGLKLMTPESFLDAIAEGNEPTASDKATVDAQIRDHKIKVFVFNSQNSTPDVQRLVDAARHADIPVVTVTETLTPENATFQAWQVRELRALLAALARATGPVNALSFASRTRRPRRPHRLARREARDPRARVRRDPRPERRREVDAAQRDPRPRAARARARSACSAGRPASSNHEIGYLPQRRSFDPSVRIRGIDIVRLGLDGDRYGIPLPGARSRRDRQRVDELIDLVGAHEYAGPPDRAVLGRRAAAAPDRAGAGAPAAAAAARRTARQPRSPEPGRRRRARRARSAGARASRC